MGNSTHFITQQHSAHLDGGDMMGRIGWFGACDVRGRCAGPGSSAGRAGEYGPESGGRTTGGRGGRVGEFAGICGSILRPSQCVSYDDHVAVMVHGLEEAHAMRKQRGRSIARSMVIIGSMQAHCGLLGCAKAFE